MNRKMVVRITTALLLVVTIMCVGTGLIKWPGLIPTLGLTYRQVPLSLITDIHDWSGVCMTALCIAHVVQFRGFLKRIARSLVS
jgi:hypothetical protein